jgi:hypothetical protein
MPLAFSAANMILQGSQNPNMRCEALGDAACGCFVSSCGAESNPDPERVIYQAMHQITALILSLQRAGSRKVWRGGGAAFAGGQPWPLWASRASSDHLWGGYFPHAVMQQARTHRVGISFDVQILPIYRPANCRFGQKALVRVSGAEHNRDCCSCWRDRLRLRQRSRQRAGGLSRQRCGSTLRSTVAGRSPPCLCKSWKLCFTFLPASKRARPKPAKAAGPSPPKLWISFLRNIAARPLLIIAW